MLVGLFFFSYRISIPLLVFYLFTLSVICCCFIFFSFSAYASLSTVIMPSVCLPVCLSVTPSLSIYLSIYLFSHFALFSFPISLFLSPPPFFLYLSPTISLYPFLCLSFSVLISTSVFPSLFNLFLSPPPPLSLSFSLSRSLLLLL